MDKEMMTYLEWIRKEGQKYHEGARKVNWRVLASRLPRIREDYGKWIRR